MSIRPSILIALALASTSLSAQSHDEQSKASISGDTRHTITPSLLTRIAVAVDGHRTGEQLWVVAAYRFPHKVIGVFSSAREADQAVREKGGEYGSFGPFTAPSDGSSGVLWAAGDCRKGPDSDVICFPTVKPPRPVSQLASATLVVRAKDGTVDSTVFDPSKVEALFFTMSAIDRLLIPYYVRVYGVDYASQLRGHFAVSFGAQQAAISAPRSDDLPR